MTARKRPFVEVIDLTNEDSDSEDPLANPTGTKDIQRIDCDSRKGRDRYGGPKRREPTSPSRRDWPPVNPSTNRFQLVLDVPAVPPVVGSQTPAPAAGASIENPFEHFKHIVKPINRSVAPSKTTYNSDTIARDVLLATSRHPSEQGLNAHFEQLKNRFTYVDKTSDLSTFRWDLVDPGGPVPGLSNMTSSSTVGTATQGDAVGSPISFQKDAKARAPLRPTRGIGRRGSRGRGRARGHVQGASPGGTSAFSSGLRHSSLAESSFATATEASSANDPGGPNKESDKESTTSSVGRRGPRKNFLGEGGKTLLSPHKSFQSNKLVTDNGPRDEKRRSGRPRTYAEPQESGKATNIQAPKYLPFICEWKDCKAELQNLETLRRHIFTVHNKVDMSGGLHCYWAGCGVTEEERDKITLVLKKIYRCHDFIGEDVFKDHIEKAHLTPVAWHMGDGPKSTLGGSEPDMSLFLMDAHGNQVTPTVDGQVAETKTSKAAKEREISRRLAEQAWNYHPEMYNPPNELFPSRIPGRIREVVVANPPQYAVSAGPGETTRYGSYPPRGKGREPDESLYGYY